MRHLIAVCAASCVVASAYAQTTSAAGTAALKGSPVSSPNRISPQVAPTSKPGGGGSTAALTFVDSTGAVIGRPYNGTLLTTLGGALTAMQLGADYVNYMANTDLHSNGFGFAPWGALYYTSFDCSGTGLVDITGSASGVPQIATTVREADGSYVIYTATATGAPLMNATIGSYYQLGQCYQQSGGWSIYATYPVTGMFAATSVGKPPFYVK